MWIQENEKIEAAFLIRISAGALCDGYVIISIDRG